MVQVRNFYLPFWVSGFSTWGESDTQFLSMLNPTTCGTLSRAKLVSPRRAPKINLPSLSPKLNSQLTQPMRGARSAQRRLASPRSESQLLLFLQIPKILSSFEHDVIHVPWSHFLSGLFILTSLIVTSAPRAREHLHSTNPCTKPKGKIYKTKNDNIKKIPQQLYNSQTCRDIALQSHMYGEFLRVQLFFLHSFQIVIETDFRINNFFRNQVQV